jgi:hypothetical protein
VSQPTTVPRAPNNNNNNNTVAKLVKIAHQFKTYSPGASMFSLATYKFSK